MSKQDAPVRRVQRGGVCAGVGVEREGVCRRGERECVCIRCLSVNGSLVSENEINCGTRGLLRLISAEKSMWGHAADKLVKIIENNEAISKVLSMNMWV